MSSVLPVPIVKASTLQRLPLQSDTLPSTNRTMRWKWIWPGAIISTFLFESVKNAFVWYIESVPTYTQLYGALTSVVILMLWAYLSGLILMLGAKINYEYENVYFPEEKYHLRRGNFFN
mgnify:CR=1 FL=1